MNQYLLILSVGPVQSMIVSARKSRDLWSGSGLLSELAKACAQALYNKKADLIFPAIDEDPARLNSNSDFSVGNKIQALVQAHSNEEVLELVNHVKQAAKARFLKEAAVVLQELKTLNDLRLDIWEQQINDYLEIQAAWANLSNTGSYAEAVNLAGQTLASRKATRDFKAAASSPYETERMLPKSSLDGSLETILKEDKKLKSQTRRKLGLSASEQLDSLGVIKRLGLKKQAEQFTPFSRITADAWIEKVAQDAQGPALLETLSAAYQQLVQADMATRVQGNQGIYANLAYDSQFLYRYRLEAEQATCNDIEEARLLSEFGQAIKPIWRKFGQPCSYGVLLLADGDRMGELLDQATCVEDHKAVTTGLSFFAGQVADIMRQYRGHCIYAGGDDVLGFVPLDQAYECAKALSLAFANSLEKTAKELNAKTPPTLSVGLAIAHHLTPLSKIRQLAAQAEKHAKGDHVAAELRRNALGVALDVRSGNVTLLRMPWNNAHTHQAFNGWITHYAKKQIPSRIAYGVRDIDLRTHKITQNKELLKKIQAAELKRMLQNARLESGQEISKEVIEQLNQRALTISLQELADELIVARWFAAKTQTDLGKDDQ